MGTVNIISVLRMRKLRNLERLEDLIRLYTLINGQTKAPNQVLASTPYTNLVSVLPLWVGRAAYLTGSRLYSLSFPSCLHTQMNRISSWSIVPTCPRTPASYGWSSWVPRMQGSQHSPTSCWAEKYAAPLTYPATHTLFISPCVVLEGSGTSVVTSLFLAGVSCLQEGTHHSLPSSGGHHGGRGPGGGYWQ